MLFSFINGNNYNVFIYIIFNLKFHPNKGTSQKRILVLKPPAKMILSFGHAKLQLVNMSNTIDKGQQLNAYLYD